MVGGVPVDVSPKCDRDSVNRLQWHMRNSVTPQNPRPSAWSFSRYDALLGVMLTCGLELLSTRDAVPS